MTPLFLSGPKLFSLFFLISSQSYHLSLNLHTLLRVFPDVDVSLHLPYSFGQSVSGRFPCGSGTPPLSHYYYSVPIRSWVSPSPETQNRTHTLLRWPSKIQTFTMLVKYKLFRATTMTYLLSGISPFLFTYLWSDISNVVTSSCTLCIVIEFGTLNVISTFFHL